jgi:hypothetical protein
MQDEANQKKEVFSLEKKDVSLYTSSNSRSNSLPNVSNRVTSFNRAPFSSVN